MFAEKDQSPGFRPGGVATAGCEEWSRAEDAGPAALTHGEEGQDDSPARTSDLCAALCLHFNQRLEAAVDHPFAVEGHIVRIALQPRVLHHLLVELVALLARFVDDPGEHHDLVVLRLHGPRE